MLNLVPPRVQAPVASSPERHPVGRDPVSVPSSPYASSQLQRVTRAGHAAHQQLQAAQPAAPGLPPCPGGLPADARQAPVAHGLAPVPTQGAGRPGAAAAVAAADRSPAQQGTPLPSSESAAQHQPGGPNHHMSWGGAPLADSPESAASSSQQQARHHFLNSRHLYTPPSPSTSSQPAPSQLGLAKPGSHNVVVTHRQRAVGSQQSPAGPQVLLPEPVVQLHAEATVQQPLAAAANGHQEGVNGSQFLATVVASANGVVAQPPAGTAHGPRSSRLDELVAEHHDHTQHQQADTHRNAVDKLLLEASSDED